MVFVESATRKYLLEFCWKTDSVFALNEGRSLLLDYRMADAEMNNAATSIVLRDSTRQKRMQKGLG